MMVRLRELADSVQCSVHHPSPFICTHIQDLLPTWHGDIGSAILVLQRCPMSLSCRTAHTEQQKDTLRDRFIQLGRAIAHDVVTKGYNAELFDPKSGFPLNLPRGSMKLDDVAIAQCVLRYPVSNQGRCTYLIHPQWGDAVYPSTIITSAPLAVSQRVLYQFIF